jgi:hypothetical protein
VIRIIVVGEGGAGVVTSWKGQEMEKNSSQKLIFIVSSIFPVQYITAIY